MCKAHSCDIQPLQKRAHPRGAFLLYRTKLLFSLTKTSCFAGSSLRDFRFCFVYARSKRNAGFAVAWFCLGLQKRANSLVCSFTHFSSALFLFKKSILFPYWYAVSSSLPRNSESLDILYCKGFLLKK